jgi:hypothetical protein
METISSWKQIKQKGQGRLRGTAKRCSRAWKGKTISFDSKREAEVWDNCVLLEKAGKIEQLVPHPKFQLIPANEDFRAMSYLADMAYVENGKTVVIDVKPKRYGEWFKQDAFKFKEKLFRHFYGYCITLVE